MSVREVVEVVAASESRASCEDSARVVLDEGVSGEGYAWVLDGSSGYGSGFTGAESDGVWYVEELEEALESRVLDWQSSLGDVVEDAIGAVAMRVAEVVEEQGLGESRGTPIQGRQLPSATVALARWSERRDVIEVFNLGDAVNVVRLVGGRVEAVSSPGLLDELEEETRRLVELEDAMGHKEPRQAEAVREQIRRTRPAYVNVPSGYWVARVNPVAARFASTGEYALSDVDSLLVCSDGVSGSVERFGLYGSWAELMDVIEGAGAQAMVDDIREAEREGGFDTSPESKQHDDIGVGFVAFDAGGEESD